MLKHPGAFSCSCVKWVHADGLAVSKLFKMTKILSDFDILLPKKRVFEIKMKKYLVAWEKCRKFVSIQFIEQEVN